MPIFKGRWTARVEQDFEIEAENKAEFERLIEQEMSPQNAVELMDFEYEVEEPDLCSVCGREEPSPATWPICWNCFIEKPEEEP